MLSTALLHDNIPLVGPCWSSYFRPSINPSVIPRKSCVFLSFLVWCLSSDLMASSLCLTEEEVIHLRKNPKL